MKTLFLLRHAKATSPEESATDIERPLSDRGLIDSKKIGAFLKSEISGVQLILSSPAVRTQQTIKVVLAESGLSTQIEFDKRIYEATVSDLLEIIGEVKATVTELLVVGHNPGMENLLQFVTDERRGMAAGAVAKISCGKDWEKLKQGEGKLEWLVSPKELKAS